MRHLPSRQLDHDHQCLYLRCFGGFSPIAVREEYFPRSERLSLQVRILVRACPHGLTFCAYSLQSLVYAHLITPGSGLRFTPRRGPEPSDRSHGGGAGLTQVRVRVPRSWTWTGWPRRSSMSCFPPVVAAPLGVQETKATHSCRWVPREENLRIPADVFTGGIGGLRSRSSPFSIPGGRGTRRTGGRTHHR